VSPRQVVVVGSCNLDLIVEVPRLPAPGETTLGADVVSRPGGKGANQAVAARRLGAATAFVGAIGNDQFGTTLREALHAADLDLTGLVTTDTPSGIALILVDRAGENVIAVSSGANRHLGEEHLASLADLLDDTSVLLMQLETPVATSLAAARIAQECGARVVLNAAPMAEPTPELAQLLTCTDVLVVNEGEALTLDTNAATTGGDWARRANRLQAKGPAAVVITLGADGAVLADGTSAEAVPAPAVVAVDTTGAGDAFCGALAAALAGGHDLPDAVRRGCRAGALATTAIGAQTALPTAADLERFDTLGAGR
jgi:ribokinase